MRISKNSLEEAINPLRKINQLNCLRTFEYPRGRSRPIINVIYVVLILSYGGYVIYLEMNGLNKFTYNRIAKILNSSFVYISEFSFLTLAIAGCYHSKRFNEYVKRMSKVDETLKALGSTIIYRNLYTETLVSLIAMYTSLIFLFYLFLVYHMTVQEWNEALWNIILYIYAMNTSLIMAIDFTISMGCLKSRFRETNILLSNAVSLPSSDTTREASPIVGKYSKDHFNRTASSIRPAFRHDLAKSLSLNPKESKHLLQTTRQIHLELSRLLMTLGDVFGIQVSVDIAISIFYITCTCYYFYCVITDPNVGLIKLRDLLPGIVLLNLNVLKVISVNYACERAKCEADNTAEILHTCYGSNTDRDIKEEMRQFDMQMIQCRFLNCASGLLGFNCKLICGCLGTVTTYLVIIIQLSSSTASNTNNT